MQAVSAAESLIPVVRSLISQGFLVTAAPEAAQAALDSYAALLKHLSWVHPQFYNNGPNAVTTPYLPPSTLWPTPWTVTDWQDSKGNATFWAGVLNAIATADGLRANQTGMLIPATAAAAGSYNHWDIAKLLDEVRAASLRHVGCWAVAYDHQNKYLFATTMGKLNE